MTLTPLQSFGSQLDHEFREIVDYHSGVDKMYATIKIVFAICSDAIQGVDEMRVVMCRDQ